MIDSLSIYLTSGGTDILGTAHEFQGVEVDFGCTFTHLQKNAHRLDEDATFI